MPPSPKNSSYASVIIPVYRADSDYLIQAIQSVVAQTHPAWELILIDDACPEDSSLCVKSVFRTFENPAKIVRLKENRGVCFARNMGAFLARGKYLSFLDQDDLLKSQFLERCLAVLQAYPQIDVIRVTPEIPVDVDDIRMNALTNSLMTTSLIPRNILMTIRGWPADPIFSETPYSGEDICLKHIIETRYVLKTITDILYFHRCGHGNHTDRFLNRSRVVNGQLVITEGQEWDQKLSDAIARICRTFSQNVGNETGFSIPETEYEIVFEN